MKERFRNFCFDPLSLDFRPPKPVNNISKEKIIKLEKSGVLGITRKRDGMRHLTVITDRIKIYTREIHEITGNFPHLVTAIRDLNLPPQTILDGEILFDENGADNFEKVQRICRSSPEKAVQLQEEIGWVKYMIFDIIFWDGEKFITRPYQERYDKIQKTILKNHPHFIPIQFIELPFKQAYKLVLRNHWEGLVLWDKSRGSDFSLNGKTIRPQVCFKKKPIFEDDFIIRRWEEGKGRNKGKMGKLFLSQIDPRTGQEFSCGECGLGFSDKEREEFTKIKYPIVIQVQYFKRFPSGALFAAIFIRIRDDKKAEECIAPKSFQNKGF